MSSGSSQRRWLFPVLAAIFVLVCWAGFPTSAFASCGDYLHSQANPGVHTTPDSAPQNSTPLPSRRCDGVECQSSPFLPLPTEVPRWTRGWTQAAWWQPHETAVASSSAARSRVTNEFYQHRDVVLIEHVPIA